MWKWLGELLPPTLFALALLFIGYLAGSLTTLSDSFPAKYVRSAYQAANSLRLRQAYVNDRYSSNLWERARSDAAGVVRYDPAAARPGLTLYTSGDAPVARLVDMQGRVVHEWHRPFQDIWDKTSSIADPVREEQIYLRRAHLFPNGDLLAIYIGVGDTPWGYGMARLDTDSRVLWKHLGRFHHDLAVADDGRIYALTHRFRMRPVGNHAHLRPPLLEDFLVVLSPDGKTLEEIPLLDVVAQSRFGRLLFRVFHFTTWDPLHTNAVDVLDEASAAALRRKVPAAAPGQVLLSFRELDGGTIALLDVARREIVWALAGAWKSQHDPDILPNGNILMFDNLGDFSVGGESRVIEVDPASGGIVWSYNGSAEDKLHSFWRSAQQPLDNGNVLITESQGARLLEVTRDRRVVWEYVNPVRASRNRERIAILSWALRIDPATLDPAFRQRLQRDGAT